MELKYQNQLVQVRLGLASSLFAALRARHAATAAHCLRVALGCSSWGPLLKLENRQRDELEVAALLHDIGKIGIPDRVLLKPDPLTREERATLDQRRVIGEQILLSCCASQEVLSIVKYAPAWYDGSRPGFDRRGQQLPIGARVVSILDAYDAMTTQQVYRRAMSREWATAELFACAGTQFDPTLVEQFCDSLATNQISLSPEISRRWLHELSFERVQRSLEMVRGEPGRRVGHGGHRQPVSREATRQHARRRDLRRHATEHPVVESCRRATDGSCRHRGAAPAVVTGIHRHAQRKQPEHRRCRIRPCIWP